MKFLRVLIIAAIIALIKFADLNCPVVSIKRATRKEKILFYLMIECGKKGLNYNILKAQGLAESGLNPNCLEWRKGRVISWGIFQISAATCIYYHWIKKKKCPKNIGKWLKNPVNNIRIVTWFTRSRLNEHGSYLRVLSEHNVGCRGYLKHARHWRKMRNGKWIKYYKPYIDHVERKLGWRIYF